MRKQGQPRLGRDGISVMMNKERAIRAREVSRPTPEDHAKAAASIPALIEKAKGRRKP